MQKKYIFVFILFFLFFFQTLPVFAQGAQCDSCGTSITYSNFGSKTKTGGYLCKSCYRQQKEQPQQQLETQQQNQQQTPQIQQQQTQQQANGMQCDFCGTSITNYSNLGSKTKTGYLCKNCYRKQQEDQQQRIQSKKQWLQQQQSNQEQTKQKEQQKGQQKQQAKQQEQQKHSQKKVCTLCNKRFVAGETYYFNDNKPFCSTCYNKTFKCTFCNKPFAGKKYYLIHDKPFCSTCYNTFKERCKTCGYLIPPGEEVRNGSWVVCTSCSKDIVTTEPLLKTCYAEACKFMKAYLGLNVPVSVDNVYFSDMIEMTEKAKKSGTDYGTEAIGLFSEGKNILCQKGMSKQDSVETLVHESAHSCMHQFGTDHKASPMYKEGFAEWCAYKYIMSIGKTWHSKKDRIYAEGLRKMLELEKKMKSEDGLLEYVKTHNDFPKE